MTVRLEHSGGGAAARGALRVAYRALARTPAARLLQVPALERAHRRLTATRVGAADVAYILSVLRAAGVVAWLAGGWGCDALLAEQTRPHGDLDLVIAEADRERACEVLARHGFAPAEEFEAGLMRTALEFLDRRGRRKVALHPVDITSDRTDAWPASLRRRMVDLGLGPQEIFVAGNVAGRRLPCLSAAALVALHTGYQPRVADRRDVCVLCRRFSLPVPAGYECPEDAA